jgi:hypothetical protein
VNLVRFDRKWEIMALLDTARKLNAEIEAGNRAESEQAHRSSIELRRVNIYSEYGRRWFDELGQAMSSLASQFNQTTSEQKRHIKVIRSIFDLDRIRIEFLHASDQPDTAPCCVLYRNEAELRVSCAFRSSGKVTERHFHVLPTEKYEIKVRTKTKTETRRVVRQYEVSGPTGDFWEDFSPAKEAVEKNESIKYLDTNEFADCVLDLFVTRKW